MNGTDLTLLGDSPFDEWYAQDDDGVSVRFAPTRADKNGYLGYLYVLEFDTGVIKVGKAVDARQRLTSHRSNAEAMGRRVVAAWVSRPHGNYSENERALLSACGSRASGVIRAEYFAGVGIDGARQAARELRYEPRNERREQHDKARGEALLQMWTHGSQSGWVSVPQAYVDAAERFLRCVLSAPAPDGSVRSVAAPVSEGPLRVTEGDEMHEALEQIAAAKGTTVEEVADMSYVDILAGLLETQVQIVRNEWIVFAHENNRPDLLDAWVDLSPEVAS